MNSVWEGVLNVLPSGRRGLVLHMARPACECAHGRFSACFTAGVYLSCCLHLLSSNVKEYICAWLEAQEESLKS